MNKIKSIVFNEDLKALNKTLEILEQYGSQITVCTVIKSEELNQTVETYKPDVIFVDALSFLLYEEILIKTVLSNSIIFTSTDKCNSLELIKYPYVSGLPISFSNEDLELALIKFRLHREYKRELKKYEYLKQYLSKLRGG